MWTWTAFRKLPFSVAKCKTVRFALSKRLTLILFSTRIFKIVSLPFWRENKIVIWHERNNFLIRIELPSLKTWWNAVFLLYGCILKFKLALCFISIRIMFSWPKSFENLFSSNLFFSAQIVFSLEMILCKRLKMSQSVQVPLLVMSKFTCRNRKW